MKLDRGFTNGSVLEDDGLYSGQYLIDSVDLFDLASLEVVSGNPRPMGRIPEDNPRIEQDCGWASVFQRDRAPPNATFWWFYFEV